MPIKIRKRTQLARKLFSETLEPRIGGILVGNIVADSKGKGKLSLTTNARTLASS